MDKYEGVKIYLLERKACHARDEDCDDDDDNNNK